MRCDTLGNVMRKYFRLGRRILSAAICMLVMSEALAQAKPRLIPAFAALSFDKPVDFQSTPAFPDRVFIVEQDGRIWAVSRTSPDSRTLVLDISNLLSTGGERGLLGLAFHPDAASNGYFFVNYTRAGDGATVISRFTISASTLTADVSSEAIFLTVDQPFENHNAGALAFGSDGFLYIPLGDGGSGGDPNGNGQNRTVLLGKILRIDINNAQDGLPYAIPPTNPFARNTKGFRKEIYASGMRNPFKISFDPQTRRLWAADVGQGRQEEIDIIKRGKNYGWNRMEGTLCYPSGKRCRLPGLELPIWTYNRSLGQSITGGYVYRGSQVPSIAGQYIYADFVSGRLWRLKMARGRITNRLIADTEHNISSFGLDQDNELYLVTYAGQIFRFGV